MQILIWDIWNIVLSYSCLGEYIDDDGSILVSVPVRHILTPVCLKHPYYLGVTNNQCILAEESVPHLGTFYGLEDGSSFELNMPCYLSATGFESLPVSGHFPLRLIDCRTTFFALNKIDLGKPCIVRLNIIAWNENAHTPPPRTGCGIWDRKFGLTLPDKETSWSYCVQNNVRQYIHFEQGHMQWIQVACSEIGVRSLDGGGFQYTDILRIDLPLQHPAQVFLTDAILDEDEDEEEEDD